MTIEPIRPPLADGLLEMRLRHLMDVLAGAQGDLADAILSGQTPAMAAGARRVASVGWLMRDAANKYDRNQTGPGASLLEDRGTGARKDEHR